MSRPFDPKAAILAGLIAGMAFMMLEMALVGTIGGQSPWGPPRMIAAMAMGETVLPPPGSFDLTIFVVAMAIHLLLSVVLGFVFGWAIARWDLSMTSGILAGAVFGLLIYFVNFYGMTAVFPWFAMARGGISIVAHVAFGVVLGAAYHVLSRGGRRDSDGPVTNP